MSRYVNVQFKPRQHIHKTSSKDSTRTNCGRPIPDESLKWAYDEPRPASELLGRYLVRCKRCWSPPVVTFTYRDPNPR